MTLPASDQTLSPAEFYTARLQQCEAESVRLHRRHLLLGYLRLAWFAVAVGIVWASYHDHLLRWEWLLLPLAGFGFTARVHAKVLAGSQRAWRAKLHIEHGLARLEDRWPGLHPREAPADSTDSLFAGDLDLFGPGGLFELLCTARTSLGERRLASWLLHPAEPETISARQTAVAELQQRTHLREAVASVLGPEQADLNVEDLLRWAEDTQPALPSFLLWLAPVLGLLPLATAIWWVVSHRPALFIASLAVNWALTYLLQSRFKPLFFAAERASSRIALLADILATLEQETFTAPCLIAAQATLRGGELPASRAIRRLAKLASAIEQRSNDMVRILDALMLYSVHLGLLVQIWRTTQAPRIPAWFDATGNLESLLALSAYHFEHPQDPFPELASGQVLFSADQLGHPLLPHETCVRNSVLLDQETRLLLVSGSNMSGKSTLLRSVGVSAVMAMAGAPVRARHLRLSPMRIAASIQINDSLQGGRSRFYAEILRLRAICDLARNRPPVLFLLDELLAGTNSHDRLAGATGLVHELLAAEAIGLLSTHDLALTDIRGPISRHIRNVHFEDRIVGDRLEFDYTLRPGVVTRSNGLDLMRLIGLDV